MERLKMLVLLLLTYLGQGRGFMPNRESAILETDFTLEDIIRTGIVQALTGTVNAASYNTKDEAGDFLNDDAFEDAAFVKTDDKYSDDLVTEITHYANLAAFEHHGNPAWMFSDEKIMEGHQLLLTLRDRLIETVSGATTRECDTTDCKTAVPSSEPEIVLNDWEHTTNKAEQTMPVKKSPTEWREKRLRNQREANHKAAREILGEIFQLLSMFYSNTNWVENYNTTIYKQLGVSNNLLLPVAPPSINTCVTCGLSYGTSCQNNLITNQFLTSGYLGVYVPGNEDQYPMERVGKCRHGGLNDKGFHPTSVPGGINKISSSPEYSPHYFLHRLAANLAIRHVKSYLVDKEFGLRTVVGADDLSRIFLQMDPTNPMVFVDVQDQVAANLVKYLLEQDVNVLNKYSQQSACLNNDNVIVVIRDASPDKEFTLPIECENHQLRVVYLVPNKHEAVSGGRVKRASLTGLDAYNLIADVSGGSVYQTDKSNIGAVVDIIKESVAAKPPVTVLKFRLNHVGKDFFIPVDNLIFNVTIKIQTYSFSLPSMHLYRPDGTEQLFGNTSVATKQQLGTRLEVIKIFNPEPGQWKMSRGSNQTMDIDVGANTDLDFFYQFMQAGPGGFGLYSLIGRPIAGDNTTVRVSVPLVDKVGSVDSLLLIDRNNVVIQNDSLRNIGGRRGKASFITHTNIPAKEFMIAIEGRDTAGNTFRRLNSQIVSSLAIQLEVFPTSGALYINKRISIPYRVRNVGGGSTTIEVSISDDKSFAQSPTKHTHHVSSQKAANGTFTLQAGSIKGETTTVTISAKVSGAPNNKVQFYVRRFTVEEKITRIIDVTQPTCNITNITGKCDFGSDVCLCSKYWWEMSAIVGDVGDGLSMVFAAGAGNDSNLTTDTFLPGHKSSDGIIQTKLRADCCHQHAKITAVDLAGNVGFCDVTITPGFSTPDPKLCNPPNPQQSGSTLQIPCNTTNVNGSCDDKLMATCSDVTWSFEAHIGNGSFGKVNAVPYKAGKNATLTRVNNTIFVRTDCCHPDVYVNLIDFASNTGQCHAIITPVTSSNKTSSSESTSSSVSLPVIAGAAAGGVVVIASVTILVLYLKSRAAANLVMPLNTKFKT